MPKNGLLLCVTILLNKYDFFHWGGNLPSFFKGQVFICWLKFCTLSINSSNYKMFLVSAYSWHALLIEGTDLIGNTQHFDGCHETLCTDWQSGNNVIDKLAHSFLCSKYIINLIIWISMYVTPFPLQYYCGFGSGSTCTLLDILEK